MCYTTLKKKWPLVIFEKRTPAAVGDFFQSSLWLRGSPWLWKNLRLQRADGEGVRSGSLGLLQMLLCFFDRAFLSKKRGRIGQSCSQKKEDLHEISFRIIKKPGLSDHKWNRGRGNQCARPWFQKSYRRMYVRVYQRGKIWRPWTCGGDHSKRCQSFSGRENGGSAAGSDPCSGSRYPLCTVSFVGGVFWLSGRETKGHRSYRYQGKNDDNLYDKRDSGTCRLQSRADRNHWDNHRGYPYSVCKYNAGIVPDSGIFL